MQSECLKKKAEKDPKFLDDLCLYDKQIVEYITQKEDDAIDVFTQTARSASIHNQDAARFWTTIAVYLVLAPVNKSIDETLINEEIRLKWSGQLKTVVEGAYQNYIKNGTIGRRY